MLKKKIYNFIVMQQIKMDYDVFSYGFHVFTTYCLYLCLLIPISIINHVFLETIIFILVFTSLRQYLGGLHFSTSYLCLLFSMLVAIFVPLISNKVGYISIYLRLSIIIISFLCINMIGPVDHNNKKLTNVEKESFKTRANKTLIYYLVFELLFYNAFPIKYGNTVLITIFIMNFNLIIPFLYNLYLLGCFGKSNQSTSIK